MTERLHHEETEVHLLNEDGIRKAHEIRDAFNNLLDKLETLCFAGREFSIARTKIEEATFFAKKAMAKDPKNQK